MQYKLKASRRRSTIIKIRAKKSMKLKNKKTMKKIQAKPKNWLFRKDQ